jgi:multiple sugar transport system substrate-binding protein
MNTLHKEGNMKKLSRRDFIKKAGLTAAAATAVSLVPKGVKNVLAKGGKEEEKEMGAPAVVMSEQDKWRQFEGETVRILTENTPPSVGIMGAAESFTKLTGMKAEFTMDFMDPLKEKMFLDLRGGNPNYHINYAQPRPIGCIVFEYWQPINKFIDIKTGESKYPDLPSVPECPNGLKEAFLDLHMDAGGFFFEKENLYGLPYDSACGIMFYRKDIFDKYGKKFEDQYGKPMRLGADVSWDDVYDISMFLKKNMKGEADYPFAFHYAQNWPIVNEFTTLCTSWGVKKDGFEGIEDIFLGSRTPGPIFSNPKDYDIAVTVLDWMKMVYQDILHPDCNTWDWGGLGTAMAAGNVAIMRQAGEFCPFVEDAEQSNIAGKVGYAVVPYGPAGINSYEIGPSALAIPKALPEREQRKAWLFMLWATGPEAQWEAFTKFYGTPVRKTAFEESRKRGWMDPESDFRKAQHLLPQEIEVRDHVDGFGIGPKVDFYSEYLDIVGGEVSKFVTGKTPKPKTAMDNIVARVNRITKT